MDHLRKALARQKRAHRALPAQMNIGHAAGRPDQRQRRGHLVVTVNPGEFLDHVGLTGEIGTVGRRDHLKPRLGAAPDFQPERPRDLLHLSGGELYSKKRLHPLMPQPKGRAFPAPGVAVRDSSERRARRDLL